MEQENIGRKEREKLFKRAEILSAAEELFFHKGFTATTLDDIAVKAEFGKGTIYNYFANKEEIYLSIVEDFIHKFIEIVNEADKESEFFKEFIAAYISRLYCFCHDNRVGYTLYVREFSDINIDTVIHDKCAYFDRYPQMFQPFKNRFDKAQKEGIITDRFDIESIVVFVQHSIFSNLYISINGRRRGDFDCRHEAELAVEFILNGILKK
ncbi:MAG: TetR/AcrR family transcriptional regulator [Ignavibacteriaceae bacterium]|nr:TetR/AcrR family transcriptional regulator [Ignavibacteriaceae bacterium]